jgi:hypothetical protein
MVEASDFMDFNFFDFNEFADEAKIKPKVSHAPWTTLVSTGGEHKPGGNLFKLEKSSAILYNLKQRGLCQDCENHNK